jgi:hypothetical protein
MAPLDPRAAGSIRPRCRPGFEFGVGNDAFGQVMPDAPDHGAYRHSGWIRSPCPAPARFSHLRHPAPRPRRMQPVPQAVRQSAPRPADAASRIAAETPVASAEPCDFTTVPFSPRNTPPFTRRGSIRRCSRPASRAPEGARAWPSACWSGLASEVADQLGGALAGLQRDIAGEAVGHDHIDPVRQDVGALDKADIVEAARLGARPIRPCASCSSARPLCSSVPTFSRPTRGRASPGRCGRKRRP